MWNAIKKFPGTVVIVSTVILGAVITSMMFPERMQLIATFSVLALVLIAAFRAHEIAGWVMAGIVAVALGFWVPEFVREHNRTSDPNGTFASFFARAKEQTQRANSRYAPGAIGQAAVLDGVMSADAKLSANLEKHIIQTGSTIDSMQLTLTGTQVEGFVTSASTIKKNQEDFQRILVAGGIPGAVVTKAADTLDKVTVNVQSIDPVSYDVPEGSDAILCVRKAWYKCGNQLDSKFNGASGYGATVALTECTQTSAFIAPDLPLWATLYRVNGGPWHVLQDGVDTFIKGQADDEMEIEFVINDRKVSFDDNVGECSIGIKKVPALYASR